MSSEKPRRLDLSGRILIGLFIGVACGLFFGEYASWLSVVGDAFIRLLQMVVLPYIVVSLIGSLGKLQVGAGLRLVGKAAVVLLAMWLVGLFVFFLFPLTLPSIETASFYSSSLIESAPPVDLLDVFIPENVFESLSAYTVPAVVLFCIFLGAALIGMAGEEKANLIGALDVLREALARMNGFIVGLTPYGVFAIAASLAGTLTMEEVGRIQAYLLVYTFPCLILAFVILPGAVAALTPFSARQVMRASRSALVLAFATGKLLVVLPLLVEETKRLFEETGEGSEQTEESVELLYPVMYPIPNLGKLASLVFLPFAAWYLGRSLVPAEYFVLAGAGAVSSFAGPVVAVSFLLDMLHLPRDMMQLFIAPGVLTARIGDLLGTMHMIALVLIAGAWGCSTLRVSGPRVLRMLLISGLVLALTMAGTRWWVAASTGGYDKDQVLQSMTAYVNPLLGAPSAEVTIEDGPGPNPIAMAGGQSRMERIRARGTLRVGYRPDAYPWTFHNVEGDLVGFEIDLARRLASDLNVNLELVPTTWDTVVQDVHGDHFDIAMAAIPATPRFAERLRFSVPYLEAHLGLVVRDYRVREFSSLLELRESNLTLAMPYEPYFSERIRRAMPNTRVRTVASPREFFEAPEGDFDAIVLSAESGAAWSLLYPSFQVVRPREVIASVPVVHAVHPLAGDLGRILDTWLELKASDGTIQRLYDHWILGLSTREAEPRWSVIRNVLGWVR